MGDCASASSAMLPMIIAEASLDFPNGKTMRWYPALNLPSLVTTTDIPNAVFLCTRDWVEAINMCRLCWAACARAAHTTRCELELSTEVCNCGNIR